MIVPIASICAQCGKLTTCPLKREEMGGYVCVSCIDAQLNKLTVPKGWRLVPEVPTNTMLVAGALDKPNSPSYPERNVIYQNMVQAAPYPKTDLLEDQFGYLAFSGFSQNSAIDTHICHICNEEIKSSKDCSRCYRPMALPVQINSAREFHQSALELAMHMDPLAFILDFEVVNINSLQGRARTLAILAAGYGWTVDEDSTLIGILSGDQGYASTGIKVELPDPLDALHDRVVNDSTREELKEIANQAKIRAEQEFPNDPEKVLSLVVDVVIESMFDLLNSNT